MTTRQSQTRGAACFWRRAPLQGPFYKLCDPLWAPHTGSHLRGTTFPRRDSLPTEHSPNCPPDEGSAPSPLFPNCIKESKVRGDIGRSMVLLQVVLEERGQREAKGRVDKTQWVKKKRKEKKNKTHTHKPSNSGLQQKNKSSSFLNTPGHFEN